MEIGSAALPPETWYPVRILPERRLRRFRRTPQGRRDPAPMIAWCKKEVQRPWKAILEPDMTPVFWFEHSEDAQRFALRFFPFKCS